MAALPPVNADRADLAGQCIAAQTRPEEMLRRLHNNADDAGLVMRLNAQYGSITRATRRYRRLVTRLINETNSHGVAFETKSTGANPSGVQGIARSEP